MSDNRIYLVPVDKNYIPNPEQHQEAVAFWQEICPVYDAVISDGSEKFETEFSIDVDGEKVATHYYLVAYEPHILYEYLDLDDSFFESEEYAEYEEAKEEDGEDFEFEDPTAYGENLNEETLAKFSEILGTPVEILWERV
ncbi:MULTISPECIES: hypothetical protein [unclassified Moraxella]|uniref:hypothetical protein n=1 Tax=unclassified Moraxella TaxID=2685852 RepID=UPI003AF50DC1